MAISPIGNVTYINQNSQATSQQASAVGRADLENVMSKEFQDKLKNIQEVRPTEDSQAINPDSKGNGGTTKEEQNQAKSSAKTEEIKEEKSIKSSHILDIKV